MTRPTRELSSPTISMQDNARTNTSPFYLRVKCPNEFHSLRPDNSFWRQAHRNILVETNIWIHKLQFESTKKKLFICINSLCPESWSGGIVMNTKIKSKNKFRCTWPSKDHDFLKCVCLVINKELSTSYFSLRLKKKRYSNYKSRCNNTSTSENKK